MFKKIVSLIIVSINWIKGKRILTQNVNIAEQLKYSSQSKQNIEYFYTLNTKTKIRHNDNCRYFNKSKNDISCFKLQGKACKVCGG